MLFRRNHYMYSHAPTHTWIRVSKIWIKRRWITTSRCQTAIDIFMYICICIPFVCTESFRFPCCFCSILHYALPLPSIFVVYLSVSRSLSVCVVAFACVILLRFVQIWWFPMFLCFIWTSSFSFEEHNDELDAEHKSFTHLKFSCSCTRSVRAYVCFCVFEPDFA